MKRFFVVFLIISAVYTSSAQYTEVINSKRPGFSESPYSIGTDVFQFETGLFYKSSSNEYLTAYPNTYGGELFFRYSKFLEKLELDVKITYQSDEVKNPFGPNYRIGGLSELTIGGKYLIYEQKYTDKSKEIRSWKRKMAFDKKRLIPSVGVYVGVNTNFLGNDYKEDNLSFKAAVLLQNDFTDRLVLLTNIIADKISSQNNYYSYILTMTYAINQNWSFFVENQGVFKSTDAPKFHFGTGAAYLFSEDLQIDASIRSIFFQNYSFAYSSLGVAWRLDKHQDKLVRDNSVNAKSGKSYRKKGNFFSRIFKPKNNIKKRRKKMKKARKKRKKRN